MIIPLVKELKLIFTVSATISLFSIVTDGLDISVIAKRRAPWISGQAWEPIYIGTNQDPLYDERLHWEGKADKMSQVAFFAFRMEGQVVLNVLVGGTFVYFSFLLGGRLSISWDN